MRFQSNFLRRPSGYFRHYFSNTWRPFTNAPPSSSALLFFSLFLFTGALLSTRLLHFPAEEVGEPEAAAETTSVDMPKMRPIVYHCTYGNLTQTCPREYPTDSDRRQSGAECPQYFRWIHEDLRPWTRSGVTRGMVERARRTADFRLVILKGRAFVERYEEKALESRAFFTLWGILQLLRRYPGKVPDLELMFDCFDWPVIVSEEYGGPNATAPPPPLFRYCGDDATLDIVFPDWSFWGWPDINIRPWEPLLKELEESNSRSRWTEREPLAYWKGNPEVAATRQDLLKCNVSDQHDWNARLYPHDWDREIEEGFKKSNLASQCTHRYKIYIEGSAWSVSEKYILACDSPTLLVKPQYYDFFTRSLIPVRHYWPIRGDDKCRSIKFAVDWGNRHKNKAQLIGKAGSDFIKEELKMENVYDYMFHLLNEYAKLLTFKPAVTEKAVELCSERMMGSCGVQGLTKKFLIESMVNYPADASPCIIPPPFTPPELHTFLQRKVNSIKQVEVWEKKFWDRGSKHV